MKPPAANPLSTNWELASSSSVIGTMYALASGRKSGVIEPSAWKTCVRISSMVPASISDPNPPFRFGHMKASIPPPIVSEECPE